MKKLVLYGTGYLDVIKLVEAINRTKEEWQIVGFLEDRSELHGTSILGYKVLGGSELIDALNDDNTYFFTTYYDKYFKKRNELMEQKNCKIPSLVHPSVDLNYVKIGKGCFIPEGCIFGTNVKIGDFVSIRSRGMINHDATVEDFAFVGPGCIVGSGTTLKKQCFLGAGATIILNHIVGEKGYVGAGSVVNRDVSDKTTVVGVPAKKIKRTFSKRISWKFSQLVTLLKQKNILIKSC